MKSHSTRAKWRRQSAAKTAIIKIALTHLSRNSRDWWVNESAKKNLAEGADWLARELAAGRHALVGQAVPELAGLEVRKSGGTFESNVHEVNGHWYTHSW